jgi:glycosyltransferase involved in cell wall biosynthesis
MKICHVITRLIVGGAQENTVLSCAGLAARGHDVTLVAGPETGPEGSLWEEAERYDFSSVRSDHLVRNPSVSNDLRCLYSLTEMFNMQRFDIVHTHSSKAGILGRWAAARAGVRGVVHTIHGMSFNRTQRPQVRWCYRAAERWAAKWTDRFVSVADAMTDQAVAAGIAPRSKFTTVHSGIQTEYYVPDAGARDAVRREWGVDANDIVVATVARLFRNKGYDELISAMPAAVAANPRLKFVWIGDGANRESYVKRVRSIGLGDRLRLTGLVRPAEIPRLLNGADILVHGSRWEGLPRVLVQGLLMEVPGVSFDIDGAPEVIADGETGCLVPLGDTGGLAGAICKLASDKQLREKLGREGRRRCVEEFSTERMVKGLERLYAELKKA